MEEIQVRLLSMSKLNNFELVIYGFENYIQVLPVELLSHGNQQIMFTVASTPYFHARSVCMDECSIWA